MVSRLSRLVGTEVPVRGLFEHPILNRFAQYVDTLVPGPQEMSLTAIPSASRAGNLPLSQAQERLWFWYRLEPNSAQYNITFAFEIEGTLQTEKLEAALQGLVRRHTALRTVFRIEGNHPVQVIQEEAPFSLTFQDITGLTGAEQERQIQAVRQNEKTRPFDLEMGPSEPVSCNMGRALFSVWFYASYHLGWVVVPAGGLPGDASRQEEPASSHPGVAPVLEPPRDRSCDAPGDVPAGNAASGEPGRAGLFERVRLRACARETRVAAAKGALPRGARHRLYRVYAPASARSPRPCEKLVLSSTSFTAA